MNGVKKFVQAAQHNAQQIETTRQARAAKNPNMNEALPTIPGQRNCGE